MSARGAPGRVALLALLAVLPLLAGGPDAAPLPAAQRIAIRDVAYEFEVAVANRSQEVRWTNLDHEDHTVTSTLCAGACSFDSGRFGHAASFAWTPAEGGLVDYHCEVHEQMRARLVVQTLDPRDPDPGVGPGSVTFRNDGPSLAGVVVPLPYRYVVMVDVANPGLAAAEGLRVRIEYAGPGGARGTVGAPVVDVPAEGRARAEAAWDATALATKPGDYVVTATLDPAHELVEGRETDNEAAGVLAIAPGGLLLPA